MYNLSPSRVVHLSFFPFCFVLMYVDVSLCAYTISVPQRPEEGGGLPKAMRGVVVSNWT